MSCDGVCADARTPLGRPIASSTSAPLCRRKGAADNRQASRFGEERGEPKVEENGLQLSSYCFFEPRTGMPRSRDGEVSGEALAGASDQARRGSDADGEQAFYRDAAFAQDAFEVLVFERVPGFEAADLAVDRRRQREGGAGELPVFRSPGVVGVGEELAVAAVAAFGVPVELVSR